jgi:hypothetical protein
VRSESERGDLGDVKMIVVEEHPDVSLAEVCEPGNSP